MAEVEQGLENLKASMSSGQRKMMAELVGNELKRREKVKEMTYYDDNKKSSVKASAISGGLSKDDVGELYRDVRAAMSQIEKKKQSKKTKPAKVSRIKEKLSPVTTTKEIRVRAENNPITLNTMLMYGVLSFGIAKIAFSSFGVTSLLDQTVHASNPEQLAVAQTANPAVVNLSEINNVEREVLTDLDDRRVQLEKRRSALELKEQELERKESTVAEKIAELKTLTIKLDKAGQDKNNRENTRLEQLANVYGSMAPNEAALIIAKLDDKIAIPLLEYLPSKRMGQILGLMSQERAVELTRALAGKKNP